MWLVTADTKHPLHPGSPEHPQAGHSSSLPRREVTTTITHFMDAEAEKQRGEGAPPKPPSQSKACACPGACGSSSCCPHTVSLALVPTGPPHGDGADTAVQLLNEDGTLGCFNPPVTVISPDRTCVSASLSCQRPPGCAGVCEGPPRLATHGLGCHPCQWGDFVFSPKYVDSRTQLKLRSG